MTRELAGAPVGETAVPEPVAALAAGAPVTPVWENSAGGLTFRIGHGATGGESVFVKWDPIGSGESLAAEADRLAWLRDRFPAPQVIASGADSSGEWLATGAIAAESAVSDRWRARPDAAARAMGEGLRRLHDTVEAADCPFDWSVRARIAVAERAGIVVPAALHRPPPADRLVVCHGDPCAPNTLIDEAGGFAALVDLARLGVADRWADLAVGSWSLEWNFGDGYEPAYFEAYGIEPDAERIGYYRALWDAT